MTTTMTIDPDLRTALKSVKLGKLLENFCCSCFTTSLLVARCSSSDGTRRQKSPTTATSSMTSCRCAFSTRTLQVHLVQRTERQEQDARQRLARLRSSTSSLRPSCTSFGVRYAMPLWWCSLLYQLNNFGPKVTASTLFVNFPGNDEWYFIVLNCDSENGLSSLTCGLL